MKISELKKGDILEYSYSDSSYDSKIGKSVKETKIRRDMVMFVSVGGAGAGVIAVGGIFNYDVKDFEIMRVWRENDDNAYVVIYNEKEVVN